MGELSWNPRVVNLIASNMRGPDEPLWLAGRPLEEFVVVNFTPADHLGDPAQPPLARVRRVRRRHRAAGVRRVPGPLARRARLRQDQVLPHSQRRAAQVNPTSFSTTASTSSPTAATVVLVGIRFAPVKADLSPV
jgi:hypothetical protein